MQRSDPLSLQIDRIVHYVGVDQILVAVGFNVQVPVLGEHRTVAVRNAVLSEIARAELCGDRLDRSVARTAAASTRSGSHDPLGRGRALPRFSPSRPTHPTRR